MTSVSSRLATWALDLEWNALPGEVVHAAKRHMLDGVGLAIAARRWRVGQAALEVSEQYNHPDGVRTLGDNARLLPGAAALVDGVLIHALDFDDTHAGGLVHATAVTLPAALAMAQRVGACGEEAAISVVVGLEAVCRIASASPYGFQERGVHATSVCGTVSSSLVASRLLGSDIDTSVNAMGIAGSLSSGLLEFLDSGSDTKTLHPGFASMNGLLAADMAAAGGNGPATVLEGRRGILATMSARKGDHESIVADLGNRWECTRISIKPIPACQLLHVSVDAAQGAPGAWQDIVQVEVEVHPDSAGVVCEPRESKNHPKTPYDAKFSLPWSVAAQLVDGQVSLDTYSESGIARPEVCQLAEKVKVVVGPAVGAAANAPGEVRITYADGSTWRGSVAGSRGTSERPLSDADLEEKFRLNCGDNRRAQDLRDAIWALENEKSVDRIHDLAAEIVHEEVRAA